MLRIIRSLHKNQAGYTLIELIAVLAISSIISLGALMANGQVITQTVKNSDFTTANRHVLNAIQWMSRDAQMAQEVTGYYINTDNTGFPVDANLIFSWETWDNHEWQVVYSIDNEGHLKRTSTTDGGGLRETLVAQYLRPDSTNCTWYQSTDNRTYQLTMTVCGAVGAEKSPAVVTKQKTVSPRPLIK
jgi:prepilin-type N-terminal cleavage/methylation domain-containing protein